MIKTLLMILVIALVAFFIVGQLRNGHGKEYYAAPAAKVVKQVSKDVATGAEIVTEKLAEKTKELTK